MLKLQYRGQPDRYAKLVPPTVTIGRDPKNQLVVDDPTVSDFHAEISLKDQQIFVMDLLSSSGTFVNDKLIKGPQRLQAWDVIRVGTVDLEINDPNQHRPGEWALLADSELLGGQQFVLLPKTTVGRERGCDFEINSQHLSRRHAEIHIEDERLRIVDLESRNGTFINGERITEAYARPGDEIRFDQQKFIIAGPVTQEPEKSATEDENTQLRTEIEVQDETLVQMIDGDATQILYEEETQILPSMASQRTFLVELDSASGDELRYSLDRPGYSIGRSGENDLVLADASVSKQHAVLIQTDGQWSVEDRESRNGVFVNGEQVTRASLSDGDLLRLGKHELRFEREQTATQLEVENTDRTMVFTAPQMNPSPSSPGLSAKRKDRTRLPTWFLGSLLFALCLAAALFIFLRRAGTL